MQVFNFQSSVKKVMGVVLTFAHDPGTLYEKREIYFFRVLLVIFGECYDGKSYYSCY